jgi:hypothetical protein
VRNRLVNLRVTTPIEFLNPSRSFLAGIAVPAALVGQAGRYAALSNKPAIHNFRL